MVQQLSALRVSLDMDSRSYQQAAQGKVAADQAMIAAMNDNIARRAAYTDALAKHNRRLDGD